MSVIAAPAVPENGPVSSYRDPVVQDFYRTVVQALEAAPDGATAATEITGAFHREHHAHVRREDALTHDIRHLSAENTTKAAMLHHAQRSAARLMEESVRQAGRVHRHQDVESRLHDLAAELDESAPGIAERIRDILLAIAEPAPPALGPIILAFVPDSRSRVGWFARSDRSDDQLQPLPFAGWALVASVPDPAEAPVQAAFLVEGTWMTKSELAMRGMSLRRLD